MSKRSLSLLAGLLAASFAVRAEAAVVDFTFAGPGVSGKVELTYGTATDLKFPGAAFEVTGISGTFTDTNNGLNIVNAQILGLKPVTRDTPDATNMLAPNDFSRFAVASGLSPQSNGFATYDNLFWPGGSQPTATDYQVHGGILDIYGLLFDIGGGRYVNLWSNGDFSGTGAGPIDYGVSVVTAAVALDYVQGGVSVVPEPGSITLLGIGLIGPYARRRSRPDRRPG